jgi:5-methylcytosine-specific restriction endonuclease McrA
MTSLYRFVLREEAKAALRRERQRLKRPRSHIPKAYRAIALAPGRCVICGATEDLHVDHRVALARGGDNHPSNLQALCRRCNLRKGVYGTNESVARSLGLPT